MNIRKPLGNMYKFVTGQWNPIKGTCYHKCSYCYMRTLQPLSNMRLAEYELRGPCPKNGFIFIGSSTDVCCEPVKNEWIQRVLDFCVSVTENQSAEERAKFMIQTKNPARLLEFISHPFFAIERGQAVVCTTIETNRHYPEIMNRSPLPKERAEAMAKIASHGVKTYVTVEPIMEFDLEEMVELIKMCKPEQVNIGKNTDDYVTLPNPTIGATVDLIKELKKFTRVEIKTNSGQLKDALKQVGISVK